MRIDTRGMLAIEAHRGRSWNTFLFSHRDPRNLLDSLTQDTKLYIYGNKMASQIWNDASVYIPIHFQILCYILSSLPLLVSDVQVSLFPFPFVLPGLYSCLLVLMLEFSSSLAMALWTSCSVPVCLLQVPVLSSGSVCLALVPGFPKLVEWSGTIPAGWTL